MASSDSRLVLPASDAWVVTRIPQEVRAQLGENVQAWRKPAEGLSHLLAIRSHTQVGWRLTVAHLSDFHDPGRPDQYVAGRLVTRDEWLEARYRFIPEGVLMAVLVPPHRDMLVRQQHIVELVELATPTGAH